MCDPLTALCRLCAESKTLSKLVDLQDDEDIKRKAMEKLSRLGLKVNLAESDDILPKTVCLPCMDSLDKSFTFVNIVEAAQSELQKNVLTSNIKLWEVCVEKLEDSDNSFDNSSDNLETQFETNEKTGGTLPVKVESPEKEPVLVESKVNSATEISEKAIEIISDTLPLSQLKLSWKAFEWVCSHCNTIFPDSEELKKHSMQFHEVCNAYRCTDCNRRKYKLDTFVVHVSHHRTHLLSSCYKCHLEFEKLKDLRAHKKTHIDSKHRCLGCNTTFSSKKELTKHMEKYNRRRRTQNSAFELLTDNLTCKLCKKTFKSKFTLKAHLKTHSERNRDHTCDVCGKCFFTKGSLVAHLMQHEDRRPFPCEICKFRFRTKKHLLNHIGVHSGAKPFSCEQCGKQFRLEDQLTKHSIVHTDALPFICSVCNKGFKFKSNFTLHMRQHTGFKPYNCKFCERDFTNWQNYNKHMKGQHSIDIAKKKHTPDGLFPIDPKTGEVLIKPPTEKGLEWMKKMLDTPVKEGRPKGKSKNAGEKTVDAGEV